MLGVDSNFQADGPDDGHRRPDAGGEMLLPPAEKHLGRWTARNAHRVAALGPAFSDQQVPVVADPVQVWALRELAAGAGPQPVGGR